MKRRYYYLAVGVFILVGYYFSVPHVLFHDPYSTVLETTSGELLSATIAADGQWRFPQQDTTPDKFKQAIVAFEDKRFWHHPGVDVLAFGRALQQNISAGKIVSGGSTLSMQVIRLSRKGRSRTVLEKCWEMILATRLELRYTKEEIINLYAAHAPFGGNVVGIEAACWRYFGRDTQQLSWAEAAMLAVLPNAPALIHPGKNREALLQKRDGLLEKLWRTGVIDSFTCVLAQQESIPEEPRPLPRLARHLLTTLQMDGHDQQRIQSTINFTLQTRVEQLLRDHQLRLQANEIHHAAVLVAEVQSGKVLAYAGNAPASNQRGDDVDIIHSPRSTGSILKPFLFAAMLDEGKLLPTMLLSDIPVYMNGFAPKNFSRQYDGVVPAREALIRSLNVPAVYLLRDYRSEKFHALLKQLGMTTLNKPPDHYGLSLILGGAEATLWDITGMYASMGRTLNAYVDYPGKNKYNKQDIHPLQVVQGQALEIQKTLETSAPVRAGAIYQTLDILTELYRPGEESGWKLFTSARKIAWKTGTSFGFRDGWAVGMTKDYVIGIWVGNANGEGRPGLTGTEAAAPILFDVLAQLPDNREWFVKPKAELQRIPVCATSGYRLNGVCPLADSLEVVEAGLQSAACPHHKLIHVTPDGKHQVHAGCESVTNMFAKPWFTLSPIQEYYYRGKHISYKSLPPFRKDCGASTAATGIEFIYPKVNSRVFIPRGLDGKPGRIIAELAHATPKATVYWHLDDEYIGATFNNHRIEINPGTGTHRLTVVDGLGNLMEIPFQVLSDL